jgi:hypothetical protein
MIDPANIDALVALARQMEVDPIQLPDLLFRSYSVEA